MKVKELVARLNTLDQELQILCYTEDEPLLAEGHSFRLLDIESVDVSEGEMRRGGDNLPTLKLGKGPSSVKLAMISVVGEF
jgi:hypothetical protein